MTSRFLFLKSVTAVCAVGFAINAAWAGEVTIAQRRQQLQDAEEQFSVSRRAGPALPADLKKLQDYLDAGLSRNNALRSAFLDWKAAFQTIAQEFSLPDPEFSYTYDIDEIETRVGPQERTYSIRQRFPFPDKLWARRARAFKESEMAYQKFQQARLDLIYQITEAYVEYAYLAKAVLITRENMQLLKSFEGVAQAKYSSGLTKNQDLLKVQVELGRLENEVLSLEDMRLPLASRLAALLDLPGETELPWPEELLEEAIEIGDVQALGQLLEQLPQANPGLLAAADNIGSETQRLRLAKREYVPDLTIGVTRIDTGEALNPGTVDSGKDPVMVMFSVNVPIWFPRLQAGVREAKSSLAAAEEGLRDQENDLTSRLAMVHYKLRDAVRQARLYREDLIPKSVQTLNATRSGYESGGADFLSLIDAQRMLLNFQLAYYRYNATARQRAAEINMLTGRLEP